MKNPKQPIIQVDTPDQSILEAEFTEIFETPLQNKMNAFWYRIILPTETFYITVIAPSSTDAQIVLRQQYPDAAINFLGKSEKIIQVG